jgi:hypothetical protein
VIHEDIVDKILGTPAITSLIGQNLKPVRGTRTQADPPLVVFTMVDAGPALNCTRVITYAFDCFATEYGEVQNVLWEIVETLEWWSSGDIVGTELQSASDVEQIEEGYHCMGVFAFTVTT